MIKFTVIIPAYQAENYLEKCIESVLMQTWNDLEIILVDDGSTDRTPDICDRYAVEYDNIAVVHQVNKGLSEARNAGIREASGEYVLFLDSDDFWNDPGALQRLAERLELSSADVLNFSYQKYFEDTDEYVPYFSDRAAMPLSLSGSDEKKAYLTEQGLYIASACNKALKRGFFAEEAMDFRKGVFSEDIEWCLRLLIRAKSPDFICENFYCYRQRKDSITKTINSGKCGDLCNNILRCIDLCRNLPAEKQDWAYRYTAYQFGTFFKVQAQAESFQKDYIEKLKTETGILRYYGNDKRLKILYYGCCILGMKKLCSLIRTGYRIRNRRHHP